MRSILIMSARKISKAAILSVALVLLPLLTAICDQANAQTIVGGQNLGVTTFRNNPPVADAGEDIKAALDETVMLDGTGSYDLDGERLMYSWTLVRAPEGSVAVIDQANSPRAFLTIDAPGEYQLDLVASDQIESSVVDSVIVSTQNLAPRADAGFDKAATLGDSVRLSAEKSNDPDGDELEFTWVLTSAPPESTVVPAGQGAVFSVTPDKRGRYVYVLTASDGLHISSDEVEIHVGREIRPQANAGPDQTVAVGVANYLQAFLSTDADGDALTYEWTVLYAPNQSVAYISDPSAITPSFEADFPGDYVFQLVVSDGLMGASVDTVVFTTGNTAPVANAGVDMLTSVNAETVLDGTGSTDVNGDTLTYAWEMIFRPFGSQAIISSGNMPRATFIPDIAGDYAVRLTVTDGAGAQDIDTIIVSTGNISPHANAGLDQVIIPGVSVLLDGTGSTDQNGGDLTYDWSLLSKPPQSRVKLSGETTSQPSFIPDVEGIYVAQLVVRDGVSTSEPDTVILTSGNVIPVADAGQDSLFYVGENGFTSNGNGSFDANTEDTLHFDWALLSVPSGSAVALEEPQTAAPFFLPDVLGLYVMQLTVSDGTVTGPPETITLEVVEPKALLSATPALGVVPLEVALSAEMLGGIAPYTYAWDNEVTEARYNRLFPEAGIFEISVTITDSVGYSDTATQTITVRVGPTVQAFATPSSGGAPLEVNFSATAGDADGQIVLYEWDYEGDGTFDVSSETTASTSFTYEATGFYEATLRVTDNDGFTKSDTVPIIVGEPPVLDANVDPLIGVAPLSVTFEATATDPDGTVAGYEWDFDNDGTVDFTDATSGDTTYIYTESGLFTPIARAYDNDGLVAERSFVVSISGAPTSLPTAYPLSGLAPLTVTFGANGKDIDGSPEYYDWDYNGDGVRDVRLIASQNSTYTYTEPGTYAATLTVIDNDGLAGSTSIEIVVEGDETPQVSAEAIAIPNNGAAPLMVNLSGQGASKTGTIVSYAWDFNNDGTVNFEEPAEATILIGFTYDLGSYSKPIFPDVNGDGLPDMFIGNSAGILYQYTNEGTTEWPEYSYLGTLFADGADAQFDVGSYSTPSYDDLNGDGLIDFLVGDSSGRLTPLINIGTETEPLWQRQAALVLQTGETFDVGSHAAPHFFDIDNDGDHDLLVGESGGRVLVLLRSGTSEQPQWTNTGTFLQDDAGIIIDVGSYGVPTTHDNDKDGNPNLFVGSSGGRIYGYTNTGTLTAPIWSGLGELRDVNGNIIDIGSYSAPVFVDINFDGISDLFVGESSGRLFRFEERDDQYEYIRLFDTIDSGDHAKPTFVNYDGDGDFDIIMGASSGYLYYVENYGDATNSKFRQVGVVRDADGNIIDVGTYSAPTAYDWDADGDADLLVGASNGLTYLLKNIGTPTDPIFEPPQVQYHTVGPYAGRVIDAGSYATPVVYDYDFDGVQDLIVGNSSGYMYVLPNLGTNAAPAWEGTGQVLQNENAVAIDVGSYAAPFILDIDGDGAKELLIGNSNGFVYFYDNNSESNLKFTFKDADYLTYDFGSYAAPTAADMDGDGDLDFVTGNSSGLLYSTQTRGFVTVDYVDPGSYTAAFTATDDAGESATVLVPISVYEVGVPTAQLFADVLSGDAPLHVMFSFDGIDPDGVIVEYALDIDGDGTAEITAEEPGSFAHEYTETGTFSAVLTVTDNDGKSSAMTETLTVIPEISAELEAAEFDPTIGDSATIQTSITGGAGLVTVDVIDAVGTRVRRLVNGVLREPGEYRDPWDGLDDAGQQALDGVYYVVMTFVSDGQTFVFDARDDFIFEELTPSRQETSTFNPYLGVPASVSYTIPWPAEVSLYYWFRDNSREGSSIAPARTVFLRNPRPPGDYTDYWDGFDDQGIAVDPGIQYPTTLWLYKLPPNAIILTGNTPEITSIDLEPRYFNPTFNPYASDGGETVTLSVDIDVSASLIVEILNEDGIEVRRITATDRAAGLNSVAWDGRDADGEFVAPGSYSLSVIAIDRNGNRSIPRYAATIVEF